MTIPFVDLHAQYARLKSDIDAGIARVLAHGKFILGPEVAELERALEAYTGARHAVTCASGTDALVLSLMASGIGPGDAVFVPGFTFTATAEAPLLVGAVPAFADVDGATFNIDVADLERGIARVRDDTDLRPAAVIAVDLFGQPADYGALRSLAEAEGLVLIADAAQSFGAEAHGAKVATLAPLTATSFFPAKPLGCYGDGGAVFTDDDALAECLRSIRGHGRGAGKYDIQRLGTNSRLDTLQAAILLPKLAVLDDEQAARQALADRYAAALGDALALPSVAPGNRSAWAQYTVQCAGRDRLQQALKAAGVPSVVYYPAPAHLQPAYAEYGGGPGSLPVSEALCARVLSLPIHPYLDPAVVERVAALVHDLGMAA